VIRGAVVVRATGVERLDIAVQEGRIAALAPEVSSPAREAIDARGLHVFPAVIDAHVHFNEPGRAGWEGVATGSAALAAGGGACFIDMPLNSSPPVLDGPSFDAKLAACRAAARTDFALWGGLTPDNLDRLEELAERGVVGYKAFMSSSGIDDFRGCDDETLARGMRIAASRGLPVAVHAEDETAIRALSDAALREGRRSARDYLSSRPIESETSAISRALRLAAETGCSLHVVHTSSAAGAELVRRAVTEGSCDATCETCPHYLFLSEDDVLRLGARAKCAPPLRPDAERRKLLALVAAGGVDTVGSDHSPAPADMKKASDFFTAWGGLSGVQSTLRVLLSLDLPLPLVASLLSENVARRFHLPGKGGIRIDGDADLTLVDLSGSSPLRAEELLDRHRLSPYVGRSLRGKVTRTLVRGRTVFQDGVIAGEPSGRFLRPRAARAASL
jgi:allantoinase